MDTTTRYLGRELPHPFIAGASPLGHRLDSIKRLEDAGCAAIVLHSLFEEQITFEREGRISHRDPASREFAGALAPFPAPSDYVFGVDAYAEHVARAKHAVDMPVIASLNGTSPESWAQFAVVLEQAGADALELNWYEVVTDPAVPAAAIERQLTQLLADLKRILRIPVAVKLSPFYTAFANVARELDKAGADALVLFNRFYQPDIDTETMQASPHVELSTSAELRLRLQWLAILHARVRPALAVTGGVNLPADGIKAVLAGADAIQLVSALLRHGPAYVGVMRRGLEQWMEQHELLHLDQARGRASLARTSDPAAFERAQYMRTLQSWTDAPAAMGKTP